LTICTTKDYLDSLQVFLSS